MGSGGQRWSWQPGVTKKHRDLATSLLARWAQQGAGGWVEQGGGGNRWVGEREVCVCGAVAGGSRWRRQDGERKAVVGGPSEGRWSLFSNPESPDNLERRVVMVTTGVGGGRGVGGVLRSYCQLISAQL